MNFVNNTIHTASPARRRRGNGQMKVSITNLTILAHVYGNWAITYIVVLHGPLLNIALRAWGELTQEIEDSRVAIT